jgi:hypothetical protein
MNDQHPMLDPSSRDRIGQRLRSDYARLPSLMPERLQDLVTALLATEAVHGRPDRARAVTGPAGQHQPAGGG